MKNLLKNVKAQITAGIAIVLTTLGTVFTDKIEEFFGVEGDDASIEVVQEQNVNVEGPTIVVNIPEQQVKEKVIIKEVKVPVEKKKEKEQEIDW